MVITEVWTAHVPMEVFRLNVKHEHIRQQLPEATGYLRNCILAESIRRFYLVCFLLLQLSDLTVSHLQRIPETFWRRPDQPPQSGGEMTLTCKAGPQRNVRDWQVCF